MNNKAFTMVEIMIVAGIISTLAAISMPNLLSSKMAANETMAITSLRTLGTAMENWRAAHNANYAGADLSSLRTAIPPYISDVLASGTKNGYVFVIVLDPPISGRVIGYDCITTPVVYQKTGGRSFVVDESGVIWSTDKAGAALTAADKVSANILE